MIATSEKGPRPSMSESIRAKCFNCTAQFHDGRRDCYIQKCPLHCRMPYRTSTPNFDWLWGKWSEKHRNIIEKLGITAQEYINTIIMKDNKFHIAMSDMIRAKCFRCCMDYNQEVVTLKPLRKIEVIKGGKITTRKEITKGKNAIIRGIEHKIIVSKEEAGKIECAIRDCSLYWWTPYRENIPDYSWLFSSEHTKKHRLAIAALRISEEEYIKRLLVDKSL